MTTLESNNGAPQTTPGSRTRDNTAGSSSRRWWWFILAGGLLATACGVVALRQLVARQIPDLSADALQTARENWDENGPSSYVMNVQIEGNRPGAVHVEVQEGVVTRITRDGQVPSQSRTWAVWSVPGMFDTIERELELAEDPEGEMQAEHGARLWLRCQFDQENGVPLQFHRTVFGGGPEVYWRVTRFEPRGAAL